MGTSHQSSWHRLTTAGMRVTEGRTADIDTHGEEAEGLRAGTRLGNPDPLKAPHVVIERSQILRLSRSGRNELAVDAEFRPLPDFRPCPRSRSSERGASSSPGASSRIS